MIKRSCLMAVVGLAILLPCCNAWAGFIIDNFTVQGSTTVSGGGPSLANDDFDNGAGSTDRTITVVGAGSEVFFDGLGNVDSSLAAGGKITFTYHFDNPAGIDLHSDGLSRFLQVPFFVNYLGTAARNVQLTVNYASTVTGTNKDFAPRNMTSGNFGLQVYDGHDLGAGALASSVRDLTITLERIAGTGTGTNLGADLQAVPEPGTMALLGMSSLGAFGLAFLRRRKSAQKVA